MGEADFRFNGLWSLVDVGGTWIRDQRKSRVKQTAPRDGFGTPGAVEIRPPS